MSCHVNEQIYTDLHPIFGVSLSDLPWFPTRPILPYFIYQLNNTFNLIYQLNVFASLSLFLILINF
jgi:hypothetical protein